MKKVLLGLFVLSLFFLGASEVSASEEPWCDGYVDRTACVPGLITNESWFDPAPQHIVGRAVWYIPYSMQHAADFYYMDCEGFVGCVSLFSPADIGKVVWLKRPGYTWEGPYLVVDCSQRNHMYATIVNVKESVEVDFETAVRWGMLSGHAEKYEIDKWSTEGVEVWKGLLPPTNEGAPVVHYEWFLETWEYDEWYGQGIYNRYLQDDEILYKNYGEYLQGLADAGLQEFSSLGEKMARRSLLH